MLEEIGLTHARKHRIARAKVALAETALRERFVVVCHNAACRNPARRGSRMLIDAEASSRCWFCRGAPNGAAIEQAVDALARHGMRRIVIVGGSPATHHELRQHRWAPVEVQLIDGTRRRSARDAAAGLAWADLVVVWGAAELDHCVSNLYTRAGTTPVVVCRRRGVVALAETLVTAAERRAAGGAPPSGDGRSRPARGGPSCDRGWRSAPRIG